MAQPPPIATTNGVAPIRVSRRAAIGRWSASGLALIGAMHGWPRSTVAGLTVTVGPLAVVQDDCTVTIAVRASITVPVTIANLTPGDRYEVSGDVMESDAPDDNADYCGSLVPRSIPAAHGGMHTVFLGGRMRAVDLGLVKGIGPARDESVSPDLAELFAQVWLRNLTTGDHDGPWTSPPRAAVARDLQTWTPAGLRLGSELAIPRVGTSAMACGPSKAKA